ncbi:MAG: ribonuclease P protein component [Clostridia bacterium]|nr:ribonuclease P protein component [Clostridia bacterium]
MKRCYSLKRNKEFRHTYRVGKSVGAKSMVLVYSARRADGTKIGFSVGKKLGNAVVRNRTKRRMREAVTPLIPLMAHNSKLIFIAKQPILEESFASIRSTMRYLLKKAELLSKSEPQREDAAASCPGGGKAQPEDRAKDMQ